MADEHHQQVSFSASTTTESLPLLAASSSSQHDIISTDSLIFQSSSMASALSSVASPMLPQELITIQGLDGTDSTTSFAVNDIVASSGSAIMSTDQIIAAETEGLGVTEYQLVDSGNGELIVVSSKVGLADDGNAANITDQSQTITLNLEEATQLLLQQQGLSRTVQLADGSYQILGNSLMDKEGGLSLEVLQTLQGDFVQTIPSMESYGAVLEDNEKTEAETLDTTGTKENKKETVENELLIPITVQATSQMEPKIEIEEDNDAAAVDPKTERVNDEISHSSFINENDSAKYELSKEDKTVSENENLINVRSVSSIDMEPIEMEPAKTKNVPDKSNKTSGENNTKDVKKEPDLNSPIPVTDQTIVMIKGKKCVLSFNEVTQQMCAYPIKPPTGVKRRGRPKMTREEKEALAERRRLEREKEALEDVAAPMEQSSAAETLLELSSVGADGVRRSARKRKKARLLEEYEELDDSDEEEPFVDNQEKDPDITMNFPDLKKKKVEKQESYPTGLFANTGILPQAQKRGRGRPRRYPPPGPQIPTSIPAVIIPSPHGQTLVMAQIQNLRNFQRQLPNIVPRPPAEVNTSHVNTTITTTNPGTTTTESSTEISTTLSLGSEADSLHLDTSEALDSHSIIPTALQGDTVPMVGADADNLEASDNNNTSTAGTTPGLDSSSGSTDKSKDETTPLTKEGSDQLSQPTVIQIPENLLPMLGIKKDPIKIGLKASERELEKLKCPKCDFQGFYTQQYRAHIATHGDDIHKCKCCSYVSLDSDELLAHFKEFHPRCICPECDFMAEHAYIIKRHMMRHNAKSCTCHICGKVYKDMYILKMHVKMVHMPAEVLFECNVCSKKFTRKAHLKRHLRIHEPEKPFKCPHCEYRGCERSDISKHMLIHEAPKHECERCGKTFRHIKNKELHVKRHFGQRDYKCGVCDFFGYTFTDIRKHIERKHQDMKTLICDKCNKHFRSELALKEHQQVCNVMMIEQILAIPTSTGGTSQATIQIPTIVGPDGQRIILDGQAMALDGAGGQAISVDGKNITIAKQDGVSIVVTDDQLGLTSAEEEMLELEDEEGEITHDHQTMQIIGETIMTESGEQLHIISQDSIVNEITGSDTEVVTRQLVDMANAADDGSEVVENHSHSHNVIGGDGGVVGAVEHDNECADYAVVMQEDQNILHHHQVHQDQNAAVDGGGSISVDGSGISLSVVHGLSLEQSDESGSNGNGNASLSVSLSGEQMDLISSGIKEEEGVGVVESEQQHQQQQITTGEEEKVVDGVVEKRKQSLEEEESFQQSSISSS